MPDDTERDFRQPRSPGRVIAGIAIATLALHLSFSFIKSSTERRDRSRVDALFNAPNWDWTLPAVANWSNSQERLTANAALVVKVLRRDLNFDPSTHRWRWKLPDGLARFVGLSPGQASDSVRANAAYNLARLGPAARDATPDLIRRATDPDQTVRYNVALALAAIGEDKPAVRTALTGMQTNTPSLFLVVAMWCLNPSDRDVLAKISRLNRLNANWIVTFGPIIRRMGSAPRPIVVPALREAIQLPDQERGVISSYDSRLGAVRTYWLVSREVDLPMELVREEVALLRGSATNTVDRAVRVRSLNHLASAAIELGEIPEVRLDLRTLLGELESDDATSSSTQIKFIADELNRIEKWQKQTSATERLAVSPSAEAAKR